MTNDSLLISLFRDARNLLPTAAVLAVTRGRFAPENRIAVSLENTHGLFEPFDLPQRGSEIPRLRTKGVVSQFVTVAPQPLDDRCHALLSDPIGPFEAPMTKEGDLARSEIGTIKDLSQRVPWQGGQLPMCRHLAG